MRRIFCLFLVLIVCFATLSCCNDEVEYNAGDNSGGVVGNNIADIIGTGNNVTVYNFHYNDNANNYIWGLVEYTEKYTRITESVITTSVPSFSRNGTKIEYTDARINQDNKYAIKTNIQNGSYEEEIIDVDVTYEDISGKSLKANKYFYEQEIAAFPAGSWKIIVKNNAPNAKTFLINEAEIAKLENSPTCSVPSGSIATASYMIDTPADGEITPQGGSNMDYKITIADWATTPIFSFEYKDNSTIYDSVNPYNLVERKLPTATATVVKSVNKVDGTLETYYITFDNGYRFLIYQPNSYSHCLAAYTFNDRDDYAIAFNREAAEHIAVKWDSTKGVNP